jgi:hypothetical protein
VNRGREAPTSSFRSKRVGNRRTRSCARLNLRSYFRLIFKLWTPLSFFIRGGVIQLTLDCDPLTLISILLQRETLRLRKVIVLLSSSLDSHQSSPLTGPRRAGKSAVKSSFRVSISNAIRIEEKFSSTISSTPKSNRLHQSAKLVKRLPDFDQLARPTSDVK